MDKRLQNKTALITGGARGIGKAIAKKLAQAGANIVINYFNSSEEADNLCSELRDFGVQAYAFQANVADETSVKELLEGFQKNFSTLDILVNNAASGVLKPINKMRAKHWRWCVETNALALVYLTNAFTPLMPEGSSVLALSSLGAHRVIPDYSFIGASKAALESLIRSLSVELAPKNIRCNTISAGAVDTDALAHFPERDRLLAESEAKSLIGRNITPEDVADVAYLLTLPEAHAIRGQTIYVDAGYSILS
ncbi:MAG: enoyl-[acyl-carrier-protein] reductase FabL [Pseudomonadota bacterium]